MQKDQQNDSQDMGEVYDDRGEVYDDRGEVYDDRVSELISKI